MIKLSPREQQVVDLWSAGKPRKTIAAALGTSINTISEQLTRARKKAGFNDSHTYLCHLIRTKVEAELATLFS